MVCIYCGGSLSVTNSRRQKSSNGTWRRRRCLACGALFTTEEYIDLASSLSVTSKNGQLRPFSRDRLLLSLYKSCQHRSTAIDDAANLTSTVLAKLYEANSTATIDASTIKSTVYSVLFRFDKAAATHYQAFHQL